MNETLFVSRDWRLYWLDMREAAQRVVRYSAGMDRLAFLSDEKTKDAVLRNLEIIGEAAKSIPADKRNLAPNIDWRRIAGFRDVLAHAYFGIDDVILWDVVANKVPELIAIIELIDLPPENSE